MGLLSYLFDAQGKAESSRDLECGITTPRSPHWSAFRNSILRDHPFCEVSLLDTELEVHHIRPFHLEPELELEPSNVVVLHHNYHLLIGHLMNWKSINTNCRNDIAWWKNRIRNRP